VLTILAGRVTSITTPDSAVVATSYSGNTVTVSDQTGKLRKSVTDGLGRLIALRRPERFELSDSYDYDTLDNLITVSQGARHGSFVTIRWKRLSAATNPESGVVSYQYDSNGNLTQKTDAPQHNDDYVYDALNRVASRSYQNDPNSTRR